LTAIQTLQQRRPDVIYHQNLNGHSQKISDDWGIDADYIDHFKLGYCRICPTYPKSDSITIPYYWKGDLISLRHRLLKIPNRNDKYRPETVGLPAAIFNADVLLDDDSDRIVLVEGEFKAIALWQLGIPTCAIPGAYMHSLIKPQLFKNKKKVYVALDPGAEIQSQKICQLLAPITDARLVTLPFKPDDMLIKYGYTLGQFCNYLELGRPQ
jgi:DNA primase